MRNEYKKKTKLFDYLPTLASIASAVLDIAFNIASEQSA